MVHDPIESLDPAVQFLARQYREAMRRAQKLGVYLVVYTERHEAPRAQPPLSVSAEDHYNFDESADCGCSICIDWGLRRAEFVSAAALIPKGHQMDHMRLRYLPVRRTISDELSRGNQSARSAD